MLLDFRTKVLKLKMSHFDNWRVVKSLVMCFNKSPWVIQVGAQGCLVIGFTKKEKKKKINNELELKIEWYRN